MKYCETDFGSDEKLHCLTHDGPANHCSPNGDEWVCEKYANLLGCSCCRSNKEKLERVEVSVGDLVVIGDRLFKVKRLGDDEDSAKMYVLLEENE